MSPMPPSINSGEVLPFSIFVLAQDSNGEIDPRFNGDVTLSLLSNLTLVPNALGDTVIKVSNQTYITTAANNGVAVFSGLTVSGNGDNFRLLATSPGLDLSFSTPFSIIGTSAVAPVSPSPPPPATPSPPPPSTLSTPAPQAPSALNAPPLLSFFDSLLGLTQTVNADGSVTETASFLGIPLLVSTFDSSGHLESVFVFGINVTALFELL